MLRSLPGFALYGIVRGWRCLQKRRWSGGDLSVLTFKAGGRFIAFFCKIKSYFSAETLDKGKIWLYNQYVWYLKAVTRTVVRIWSQSEPTTVRGRRGSTVWKSPPSCPPKLRYIAARVERDGFPPLYGTHLTEWRNGGYKDCYEIIVLILFGG